MLLLHVVMLNVVVYTVTDVSQHVDIVLTISTNVTIKKFHSNLTRYGVAKKKKKKTFRKGFLQKNSHLIGFCNSHYPYH